MERSDIVHAVGEAIRRVGDNCVHIVMILEVTGQRIEQLMRRDTDLGHPVEDLSG